MRTIAILALLPLALSACTTLREKVIAAGEECKAKTFATQLARLSCYDERERPIFTAIPDLAAPYNNFDYKRTYLARRFDERKITAQQFVAGLKEGGEEFKRAFLQYETNEKAKDAKAWDDARKLLAAGLKAYGDAKVERAQAGLRAMEESKPKIQSGGGPAFLKSEFLSGLNRICIYDGVRGAATVTVASYESCPLVLD